MLEAVAAAVISNRIVRFEIYSRHNRGTCGVITLSSGNHDISDLIAILDDELRSKNPLRGNLVQILSMNGELDVRMQPKPTVSFDDVIVAQQLRDELRENTVGALRTDQNNGIICSGPPGTGKSMACAAASNECIAAGYSAAFLVGAVPFDEVRRFIDSYLAPAVICLEDIDTFAEDRVNGRPSYFADFLQFMNGISLRKHPIVVIATTNHISLLDAAIAKRPVRFNRKYEFGPPANGEILAMLQRLFGPEEDRGEQYHRCFDRGFTGAHITEIHRTAVLMSKQTNRPLGEVFLPAVEIVAKHFVNEMRPFGFSG